MTSPVASTVGTPGPAGLATGTADGGGMFIFWPICNLSGSTPGLASRMAFVLTPNFFARVEYKSPFRMTYSCCWAAANGATGTGGGTLLGATYAVLVSGASAGR